MLLKTFKYDFLSVLKLWIIAAIVSVASGAVSGICFRIIPALDAQNAVQYTLISSMLTILGYTSLLMIIAFAVLAIIIVTVRFYTSLFTDEGYLTFTLPVKRSVILNSKLLNLVSYTAMTLTAILISLIVFAAISPDTITIFEPNRAPNLLAKVIDLIVSMNRGVFETDGATYGAWFVVFEVLVVIIALMYIFFTPMLIQTALTIGATIVKRAKVFVGIAIYYGCNTVLELILYGAFIGGLSSVTSIVQIETALATPTEEMLFIFCMLLAAIAFMACCFGLMYTVMYRCLKNRLNLA